MESIGNLKFGTRKNCNMYMKRDFELAKYHNKWAVFSKVTKTFDFIGKGKRFCENKVKELNCGI